jgi:transcriptional regulator with XRE-family HTH domain
MSRFSFEKSNQTTQSYSLEAIIMTMEDISRWLLENLERKGWTQSELARQANVNQVTISNIINGNRKLGLDVAIKIADALSIPRSEILKQMGILPPSPPTDIPSIREMNEAFAYLTSEERRLWLRMIENYVADRRERYRTDTTDDPLQSGSASDPA